MAAEDSIAMDVSGSEFKRSASDSLLSPARPSAMRRTSDLPMSPFVSAPAIPVDALEQPVSDLAQVPLFPVGSLS